jgi:hypothetical protein
MDEHAVLEEASAAKMQQCAHMGRRFKRICPQKSGRSSVVNMPA